MRQCLTGARLPFGLRDLEVPPERFYVHGSFPSGPAVAIVGTRRPSADASRFTQKLAAELTQAGVVVLSGGALGIDSDAHRGALQANGSTVVVAPSALDRPYPKENAELFREVIEHGGAHVTAFAPGTAAKRHLFFARNGHMVALANAVILVEAPVRSGARNAAQWARKLARPLFVVPQSPWNKRGNGCILELRLGGQPLSRAQDVLEVLAGLNLRGVPQESATGQQFVLFEGDAASETQANSAAIDWAEPTLTAPGERARASSLSEKAQGETPSVLSVLTRGPLHPDQIVQLSGLRVDRVQRELVELLLEGTVSADSLGCYRLTKEQ